MIRALPKRKSAVGMDVSLAIVNIVLLLIFFFLATGQLLNPPAQGVDLAETTDLPLDQLPSPILVVGPAGNWELDGQPLAQELLAVRLADLPQPLTLHILISGDAPAGTLLEIVNRPELADTNMKLVTLRVPGEDA